MATREKSIHDMVQYIMELQQQGIDIILMIDANKTRENKDGTIQKLKN